MLPGLLRAKARALHVGDGWALMQPPVQRIPVHRSKRSGPSLHPGLGGGTKKRKKESALLILVLLLSQVIWDTGIAVLYLLRPSSCLPCRLLYSSTPASQTVTMVHTGREHKLYPVSPPAIIRPCRCELSFLPLRTCNATDAGEARRSRQRPSTTSGKTAVGVQLRWVAQCLRVAVLLRKARCMRPTDLGLVTLCVSCLGHVCAAQCLGV